MLKQECLDDLLLLKSEYELILESVTNPEESSRLRNLLDYINKCIRDIEPESPGRQ